MSLNVDWKRLRIAHQDLVDSGDFNEQTDIVFTMLLTNGKAKKAIVKFKDFMAFFWGVSEDKGLNILTMIVQDKEGRILYRIKQRTAGDEEVPDGGHTSVIQNWGALTPEEKDTYLDMLIAQIQVYDR